MVRRKFSFLSQDKRSSPSSYLELAISIPKRITKDFLHLPPYPSTPPPFISPSPYPSIPILPHSLISLPPSLIPPHTPPPTASRHPPAAGSHPTLHLEGSSHLFCCPANPLSLAVWFILCLHPLSGNVGFMVHHPRVKCPSYSHAPSLFDHSVCLLLEAACKLILPHLSALFIRRFLRSAFSWM